MSKLRATFRRCDLACCVHLALLSLLTVLLMRTKLGHTELEILYVQPCARAALSVPTQPCADAATLDALIARPERDVEHMRAWLERYFMQQEAKGSAQGPSDSLTPALLHGCGNDLWKQSEAMPPGSRQNLVVAFVGPNTQHSRQVSAVPKSLEGVDSCQGAMS